MAAIRFELPMIVLLLLIIFIVPACASSYNTHIVTGATGKGGGDVYLVTWGNNTRNVTTHWADMGYDYNYTAKPGNFISVQTIMGNGDRLNYTFTLSNGDNITGYINDVNMDSLFSWYTDLYLNMNGVTDVHPLGDVIPFLIHQADLVKLGYLYDHANGHTIVGLTINGGPGIDLPDNHVGITSYTAHSDRTVTYSVEEFNATDFYNNVTTIY